MLLGSSHACVYKESEFNKQGRFCRKHNLKCQECPFKIRKINECCVQVVKSHQPHCTNKINILNVVDMPEFKFDIVAAPKFEKKHKEIKFVCSLGAGGFGKVILGKIDGQDYAVKFVEKAKILKSKELAYNEMEALVLGNGHPFFPRLNCIFQNEENLIFVMELLPISFSEILKKRMKNWK